MWKLTSIIIIFVLHSAIGVLRMTPREDPLVDTKLGQVRGLMSESGNFAMFLGIPYAVVDETRPLAPSVPHSGFEEIFNANDSSIICPQNVRGSGPSGQLQCLNLNIFVPNEASSQNPLAVMVYFHGGAFNIGSKSFFIGIPRYLVEKGVVVVSINYRLGVYGFMCTDNPKAPGNIGLKDQLLALRWIKENIGDFGGDPDKITIFGESAGAMSIHFHLMSPYENLFDKAILQSGAATSPWTAVHLSNDFPLRLAELLGFVTQDVDEALDFITTADIYEAVAAGMTLRTDSQYSEPLARPCVENEFEGIERLVTVNPNIAINEKVKDMPIMIGYANQELIWKHMNEPDAFYNNYSFKDLLGFGFDTTNLDDMSKITRQFYIGDEPAGKHLENEITDFGSDFVFNHAVERTVDLLLKSGAETIFYYIFSYVGNRSTVVINNSTLIGAAHADDMNYLFDINFLQNPEIVTPEDQLIIDRMTTMWTNFAKYGDPIPQTSDLLPVKWETVSQESRPYLDINSEMTLKQRPFHDRMAFWDLFYETNDRYAMWNSNN